MSNILLYSAIANLKSRLVWTAMLRLQSLYTLLHRCLLSACKPSFYRIIYVYVPLNDYVFFCKCYLRIVKLPPSTHRSCIIAYSINDRKTIYEWRRVTRLDKEKGGGWKGKKSWATQFNGGVQMKCRQCVAKSCFSWTNTLTVHSFPLATVQL